MSSTTTSTTEWPVGRPAVLARPRGEHPHPGGALRPVAGELVVRRERAVHVDRGAVADVLGGEVPVVGPDQVVHPVVRRSTCPAPAPGDFDGLGQQLGQVLLMRRR